MEHLDCRELFKNKESYDNKDVVIEGWIRTNRGSNKFGFLEINDGTFFKHVQVVYEADKISNFEEVSKMSISAALTIQGRFVLTPEAKQPFEIKAASIKLQADFHSDYPLQKKRHSPEYLREIAHLRPRSNTFAAVFNYQIGRASCRERV
mgnify:FL=1